MPVVLTLLLAPALIWFLRGDVLPCTHDNDLHLYRITAMREALRHGWLFSRWLPNLALGYGYPFFNFREPLPYLVGEVGYALGVPLPLMLGLMYAVSLVAAGWGAYRLACDLFSEAAGWVAGTAYALGPYLLLDALRRGNLPESVALALLPWLLVAFHRLARDGGRRAFAAAVLGLVALFLSHNISSLLFAPFLGGMTLAWAWVYRRRGKWGWAFGAAAMAVAMTAWFWFPALTEQETVQLHLSRTTRNNDFHYNFLTWREMLATVPAPHDPDFLNPPMRVYLGVAQGMLAVLGLGLGWRRYRDAAHRVMLVALAVMAVFALWMATESSVWLWEAVPLLAFVQFPWRWVGRALLPAALLAGAAAEAVTVRWPDRQHWVVGGAVAVLTLAAWPDMFPPKGLCPLPPRPTLADVYAFERAGWMGVDPEGSYFPVTVRRRPTDTTLAEAFVRGEEPARFDAAALPEGGQVLEATYRSLRATVVLSTPRAFRARWLGFAYPGWRVWVDGVPVTTAAEVDSGLLTFDVPAGRHEVRVAFRPTVQRGIASMVSAVSAVTFVGLCLRLRRREKEVVCSPQLTGRVAGVAVMLAAVRLVTAMVGVQLWRSDPMAGAVVVQQPFSGGMTLAAYALGSRVEGDGELAVTLWWQAHAPPTEVYRTWVGLMDAEGRRWSGAGTARPRGYEPMPPTTAWQPGQYAYDPHLVAPLPGTPPGRYAVVATLFERETLRPASVLDADGNPLGPALTLGEVWVMRPRRVPTLSALDVPPETELRRCGAVGLWAMTTDRTQVAPGDGVAVRWVWEAVRPAPVLTAALTLRDATGREVRQWQLPPSAPWWPTDRWLPGERWVGRPWVRLPGGLESGVYGLETSLSSCVGTMASVTLTVTAPTRHWDLPPGLTPANVVWGRVVRLAGYAVEPENLRPGGKVRVQLAWQATAEMTRSYRVFVHLLGPEGRIVNQSDGEPAGWTRPTTGWAVGEVVTEVREIALPTALPPGEYVLRVGWYLPDGPRLRTAAGEDGWVAATFSVSRE